jgi:hypothetical protein
VSAVWVQTTSGALVRGDTIMWISRAATSLTVQQQGGDTQNTIADRDHNHLDLPPGFGTELAALLSRLAGQRDPHVVRAVAEADGWRWTVDRLEQHSKPDLS